MSKEKIYPQGIRAFSKRESAPDFVKGSIIISIDDFNAWLIDNKNLFSEDDGKRQIKFDLLDGRKGLYLAVNTYKKADNDSDMPF